MALRLSQLHPSQRCQVLAARRADVGAERFREEAAAIMQAAGDLDRLGQTGAPRPLVGAGIGSSEVLSIPQPVRSAHPDGPYYQAVLAKSGASHPDSRYGAGSGPRLSR